MTQGGSNWAPPVVKWGQRGQTHRRLDAGEARDGGAARKTPTGHGRGRSWAHWKALAGARRVVVEAGPVVAEADDGELQCHSPRI